MKKLFSLILVALISSQMWAVTYTATYTRKSKSYTMTAYDMGTNDNVFWGDRCLGETSTNKQGVGDYYRYGDPTALGNAASSYSYSGLYIKRSSTVYVIPADKDPATVELGEGWRMPTSAEYATLISKATFSRTSSSSNYASAVANNNTIYFFYGGKRSGFSASDTGGGSGTYARYWTSTKKTASDAYCLNVTYGTDSKKGYITKKEADCGASQYLGYLVKPVYDTKNYTLTVKADGSTSSTYPGKWGKTTTSITASKTGHTFTQWDDGNTSNPRTFKICDITYTAQFTANKYDIIYKDQGGGDYSGNNLSSLPSKHTYGTATTLVNGAKDNYTFVGWYTNSDCTSAKVTSLGATAYTGTITLYAKWELDEVTQYKVNITQPTNGTITVTNGSNNNSAVSDNTDYNENTQLNISVSNITAHYHLNSISVKETADLSNTLATTASSSLSYTLKKAVTISADIAPDPQYTVTIGTPEHGTLVVEYRYGSGEYTAINASTTLYEGAEIKVTATPAAHYTGGAVITMGGNTVNTTTFTLSAAAAISTNFDEDDQYEVTITNPSVGGTLGVEYRYGSGEYTAINASTTLYEGAEIKVTATPATHYTGGAVITMGGNTVNTTTFTLTGNVTIGATFGLEEYTISFYNGENLLSSSSAAYGSTPVQPATPTKIVGDNEYAFEGWSKTQDGAVVANWAENAKVTGNQNYYAKFSSTAVTKYTITVGELTNCKSMTLTCDGNTIEVPAEGGAYKYAEGKEIVVDAIPARGYHFEEWDGDASEDKNEANRLIDGIDDDMTLTPTFAGNTTFTMLDTWEKGDITTAYAGYKNEVLNAILSGRTFTVGQWATLSLPFNYTLTEEDDLYRAVYKFNSMQMAGASSVFIDFVRTYDIEANHPYLVVPRKSVTNPTFYGVRNLQDAAEVPLTSDNNVYFVSSLWKQTITGDKYFYVGSNSQLRFAHSGGTTIKANRAFFHIEDSSNAPRRVRIMLDGVEVEKEIAEDGSLEDVQNVRKYMENGRLVIECNGVRMDATGKKIN